MYIEAVPNRNSPPAILLRESYRHEGKVRKRTLCNLSGWSPAHIEGLRGVLKGGTVIPAEHDAFTVTRSLPHGHVAATLGTARKIGLDRILGPDGDRCRDLVLAMLAGRILDPVSKLAAARSLSPATASSSLGEALGLGEVDDAELYAALDWLLERQAAIETALARRHLQNGTLVLYDVSSSYMEGRCCPLARLGHSRDRKKGTLQIVYGLLCPPDGCPIAIEVFDGNTGDPTTLAPQIDKLKQRFGLSHVVLVGDRGMITEARITEDIKSAGLDWITALRGPAIKELLNSGALQLTLFDTRDMASITSPDFPGERLVVCRNRDLAAERARKREELLAATEKELAAIKARVERKRNPLHGTAEIALAVGAVLNTYKMKPAYALSSA
jgi:Transposase DDE domain